MSSARSSVAFVNHHDFRSNSGVHLFNIANELEARGIRCTVIVPGNPATVRALGEPRFTIARFRWLRGVRPSLVHAWTPRPNVRAITEKLAARHRIPYVVHLEDNEDLVAAADAGIPPKHVSQLSRAELAALVESGDRRYRDFLVRASGVTAVIETLLTFKPDAVPGEVVWPAYERDLFLPQPPDRALRTALGIGDGEHIVVYAGNSHPLNRDEVRSLYVAVELLNDRGVPVRLVRLGDDHADVHGPNQTRTAQRVIHVSYRPRVEVPRYLALADVLVQPGRPSAFNDYRFPSKLPEYLAMGKPVIMPRSNLGRLLRDGEQCLLLETGEPAELASRLEECFDDPALCRRLGVKARGFAEENFSWATSAERLVRFYERVLAATGGSSVAA